MGSWHSRSWVGVLVALAIAGEGQAGDAVPARSEGAAAPSAARPQEAHEAEAAAALGKAETLVAKGRHAKAVSAYRRITRTHAGTRAARTAARRILPTAYLGWADILRQGPSRNRVDVAIMGDGFELKKQSEFDDIAKTLPRIFAHNETLGEYQRYFNFARVNLVSAEAGVDGYGRTYDTALGGYVTGRIQGQVATEHHLVMTMLENVPEHDGLAIAYVKRGELGTGGGGVATIGGRSDPTTIHEWGHAFAGLGDEYTTDTGHRGGVGNRVNVSNTGNPAEVPWKHWIEAGCKDIGVYQGAGGRLRGAWKPRASSCIMERGDFFCRVCREAMVLRIYELVEPIDEWAPLPGGPLEPSWAAGSSEPVTGPGPHEFQVRVMLPKKHRIDVFWWVLTEQQIPPGSPADVARPTGSRLERGPLPSLGVEHTRRSQPNNSGLHRFKLKPADLEPGRYLVLCRVVDRTRVPGDKWPWVLKDDHGLLQSERGWRVVVE